MNTYNENLSSAVLAILQSQLLEVKSARSASVAAKITFDYAEQAAETAATQLDTAKKHAGQKFLIKTQAIHCSNAGTNLLSSAVRVDEYTRSSVTNAAVSAANIQVAANAIVKLAGDIGSIFSIINAADFDSQIYQQAKQANEAFKQAAYEAETASLTAMNASAATAEVSSGPLLNEAKATQTLLNNFNTTVSGDFATASQIVTACEASLTSALVAKSVADGAKQNQWMGNESAFASLALANKLLNLNLVVENISATGCDISFNAIRHPLDGSAIVKSYFLFLVKERNQLIFTVDAAQKVIVNDVAKTFIIIDTSTTDTIITKLSFADGDVVDTDGDKIEPGNNYVAFVMAVFEDKHKKAVNNFDDFLTSPSAPFAVDTASGGSAIAAKSSAKSNSVFGIAERKKAELDGLALQVLDAQYAVEQLQATVSAADVKAANLDAFVSAATNEKTAALANNTSLVQLIQSAQALAETAETAAKGITIANSETKKVAVEVNALIDKLIFSVDLENKLAAIITRKKALNPLISDDLISLVRTADTDADNTMALTLTALKSAFAARSANIASAAALSLVNEEAAQLPILLTEGETCLKNLLKEAVAISKSHFTALKNELKVATDALADNTARLNKAQIKLKSLQAGLAAANAAAVAS